MILVDTSIWIDHLHRADDELIALLKNSRVATHPMIIGEIALGSLKSRSAVLDGLAGLVSLPTASHAEVLRLVEAHKLYGSGLSLVDCHLLASVLISPGTKLWTRDKRLSARAAKLSVSFA